MILVLIIKWLNWMTYDPIFFDAESFYSKNGDVQNTSLAAPGALANRLQRRNARKANQANLEFLILKTEITSLHQYGHSD